MTQYSNNQNLIIGTWDLVIIVLSLSLFMLGVFTDHPDHPFSFYNFTLIADFLDRSPYLHCFYPQISPHPPFLPTAGRC